MSATGVLDAAYAHLAIRADEADRLIAMAGGRKQGELTVRQQLDIDMGFAAAGAAAGDLVPVGEFTMLELAQRWNIA